MKTLRILYILIVTEANSKAMQLKSCGVACIAVGDDMTED